MNKRLPELTTEQLIKRKKILKGILIVISVVWLMLIAIIFFLLIKE